MSDIDKIKVATELAFSLGNLADAASRYNPDVTVEILISTVARLGLVISGNSESALEGVDLPDEPAPAAEPKEPPKKRRTRKKKAETTEAPPAPPVGEPGQSAPVVEPATPATEVVEPAPEPTADELLGPDTTPVAATKEMIQELARPLMQAGRRADIEAVLNKHGADKLANLAEDKFSAVYTELQAL